MNDESTKSKILLAAGPIFARKGYKGATVREICEAAHVNVASVNYYFGDKQKLYTEAVIMARQMRVQQVPNPDWEEQTAPEEKLEDFISLILNRLVALETEPWQVRLLMRETLAPTEASRQLVEDYFRPFLNVLMSIIEEIAKEALEPHQRQMIAFSILGQCLFYRFTSELTQMMIPEEDAQHFSKQELTQHILQFSLKGIEDYSNTKTSTTTPKRLKQPR